MMTSYSQTLDGDWSRSLVYVRSQPEQVVLASYERSSVTLEEYAKKVIAYSKSPAEVARREAIDRRIHILRDAWGPLLKASIQNWLTPVVQDLVIGKNKDQLDLSRNPAKHIWKELSVLYALPPKRMTPSSELDGEKYAALVSDTGFHEFWQLVELLLNACRDVVIWPDVVTLSDGTKTIRHRCECGNTITAIPMAEDKTIIECYLHIYKYTDLFDGEKIQYRLWTNNWNAAFEEDKRGDLVRVGYVDPSVVPEADDSASNPYGRLPHYHLRLVNWPDGPWDCTSGEDLVDLTIHGGKERAMYRYMQKVSGFKQAFVTGASIDKLPQQILDPGFIAHAEGDNINLNIVDWTIDLRQRLQCMMDDEVAMAAAYGINPQRYKQTGDYQTSYSAKSSERGLSEARNRAIPIFSSAERAYKRSLCMVAAAHGFDGVPDPDVALDVSYQPIAYPEDPQSQMELDRSQIGVGVKSQIDIVKREHPEWTDEQAKDYLQTTLDMIAWVNDMKAKHNVPNNPENESASAEDNGAMGTPARNEKKKDSSPEPAPADQGQE